MDRVEKRRKLRRAVGFRIPGACWRDVDSSTSPESCTSDPGNAEARNLPDALTQPSMIQVLMSVLRLSPGEASRRVRAAFAREWIILLRAVVGCSLAGKAPDC